MKWSERTGNRTESVMKTVWEGWKFHWYHLTVELSTYWAETSDASDKLSDAYHCSHVIIRSKTLSACFHRYQTSSLAIGTGVIPSYVQTTRDDMYIDVLARVTGEINKDSSSQLLFCSFHNVALKTTRIIYEIFYTSLIVKWIDLCGENFILHDKDMYQYEI